MNKFPFTGYFRVAAAVPEVHIGDCHKNAMSILKLVNEAALQGAKVVVFPELSITGYTCGDLFFSKHLLIESGKALSYLAEETESLDIAIIVGAPIIYNDVLYNCAVTLHHGAAVQITPKTFLPNYGEFYERRWWTPAHMDMDDYTNIIGSQTLFAPISTNKLLEIDGVKIGIEICEDLWAPVAPSIKMTMSGAEIIFNLSASNDVIGKYEYLTKLIEMQSARAIAGYVYASAGFGESSTDLVFDGKAIIAENGYILARNERWNMETQLVVSDIDITAIRHDRIHRKTFADCAFANLNAPYGTQTILLGGTYVDNLLRNVDAMPFVPKDDTHRDERCSEIINIQTAALAKRLTATGCKNVVIGISGGLDSTLALLVTVATFDKLKLDRKGITGVTMPGFGTTDRTHDNAVTLMENLGITMREISIVPAVNQHFADINHNPENHDVTYENSQARQRTYLLMDIANQVGGMVIGTGDMSELALGWATYNGDHMSMYGINASIPKTLIKHLVAWFETKFDKKCADALHDIVCTPISPELIPANSDGSIKQKTEDLVGPYELHDFFLYHTLRFGRAPHQIFALALKAFDGKYEPKIILHWLRTFFRRFFNQQFKRSCMPDGPKVGSVCLSPRGDWRMPSDASSASFLREIDELESKL